MIRAMAKMFAYSRAPRTTFTLMHPKQSARLAKTHWDLRHAYAPRLTAIGAAVLALPVGILIGRLGRRHTIEH
jgi:hypothetical protein